MVKKAVIIAAGMGSRLNGNGGNLPKPLVKVAGVGLLKRTILSAKQAGIHEFVIVIGYRAQEVREAIDSDSQVDVQIDWVENSEWGRGNGLSVLKAREHVDGPFLLLMSDHLFDSQVINRLRHLPLSSGEAVLCVDYQLDRIHDMEDATKVYLEGDRVLRIGKELESFNAVDTGIFLCSPALFDGLDRAVASGDESLSGGVRALAAEGNMRAVDIGDLFWLDVDTPGSLKYAEDTLFKMLGKPTDGFISKNFNRKISTRISRLLVHTPVTPNQISIVTMLITFLSAWWIATGDYFLLAMGGLLFQFASIVDGSDGEIAKLKFMGSRLGEWVDTLADNVSYVVFFIGVSVGMYHLTGETFLLALGLVAVALNILGVSLISVYLQGIGSGSLVSFNMAFSEEVPEDKRGWFHRFSCSFKFAVRRDFFAAMFCVMALLNCLEVMYWMVVIGSTAVTAAIFGYVGYMMHARGAWPTPASRPVDAEKLVSEKAD
ncbi:MAG: NTP transferase domain-containing protein [bacterium]|nr:NTP transferase domain-containing protein [bacterium]